MLWPPSDRNLTKCLGIIKGLAEAYLGTWYSAAHDVTWWKAASINTGTLIHLRCQKNVHLYWNSDFSQTSNIDHPPWDHAPWDNSYVCWFLDENWSQTCESAIIFSQLIKAAKVTRPIPVPIRPFLARLRFRSGRVVRWSCCPDRENGSVSVLPLSTKALALNKPNAMWSQCGVFLGAAIN